jgi:serine/threonine protein phosphatase PrpC
MKIEHTAQFATHVGRVRSNNEDAFHSFQTKSGTVYIVCDGMGGHVGGEVASQQAVKSIMDYCTHSSDETPVQMLHEAIKFANSQVHAYATRNPENKGMGTTCVVVFVSQDNDLFYAHVGDSRLYVRSSKGLVLLTKDHSYVQFLVDSGQILESEMEVHPDRNRILRALGIDEVVKPTVCKTPYHVQGGETFLMCTDGLNGMIRTSSIEEILASRSQGVTIEARVSNLINAALNEGGKDNVTVGLLDFSGDLKEVPAPPRALLGVAKPSGSPVGKYVVAGILALAVLAAGGWYLNSKYPGNPTVPAKMPSDSLKLTFPADTAAKGKAPENGTEGSEQNGVGGVSSTPITKGSKGEVNNDDTGAQTRVEPSSTDKGTPQNN